MRNKPVVSTAKVRGLIKKSGIGYVDATRRNYPSIAHGISVWQLCSTVYFKVYGYHYNEVERQEILKKFTEVLAVEGLAVKESGESFQIVGQ
jgi:starvation-inducible outer membrane lipoprotein